MITQGSFEKEYVSSIDNYIYLYHLDKFIILPTMPESYNDSLPVTFSSTPILMRTAPIFSYSHSGPRTVNIELNLRRDMFEAININASNLNLNTDKIGEIGDDYVDTMINLLQACALPKYAATSKMVDPPMIAVRFGNDIFIKGVVQTGVVVNYKLPLLANKKYANVEVSFQVAEVDPYDAETVAIEGSFRGPSRTLERSLYLSK